MTATAEDLEHVIQDDILKSESFQKRKELCEQLLDINISKGHIARRRQALTAIKANPEDFDLICHKLTEWITLSEDEERNDNIVRKWENILESYNFSPDYLNVSGINPIVHHYSSLKKFAVPMLNAYNVKCL